MTSNTSVPRWIDCASTCTVTSPQGTSRPLCQIFRSATDIARSLTIFAPVEDFTARTETVLTLWGMMKSMTTAQRTAQRVGMLVALALLVALPCGAQAQDSGRTAEKSIHDGA